MSISPGKMDCIKQWPTPMNRKELQAFLGYANYHREHIRGYAGISSVLYELTGSKADFEWDDIHEQAFLSLKTALTVAPCLAYPSHTGLFILDTDASQTAIGAQLSQMQEGEERVISYASNALIAEQRRYCTTRKELLAVVKFSRHFRHYLLGRKFLLRTDHHSLVWLMRFRHAEGQLARWLEELSQYDMVIIHRAGAKHSNADGLSRIPDRDDCDCYQAGTKLEDLPCGGCQYCSRKHQQWDRFINDVDDVIPLAYKWQSTPVSSESTSEPVVAIQSVKVEHGDKPEVNWVSELSTDEVRQYQLNDPDLKPLLNWMTEEEPTEFELKMSSSATKYLWQCRTQLSVENGVLFYNWMHKPDRRKCLVVPKDLRSEVLHQCHDVKSAGHLGRDKTLARLKQRFLWYNMFNDCEIYVKTCSTCNKNKKLNRQHKAGLQSFHAGAPVERVHLDILGPFTPSTQGNVYILSIIDQFTKWIECVALPNQKAELVARAFLNQFICIFGCPMEVHTDQGTNFTSDLFQSLCALLEISKTRTTPYHPSSNGQVERYNRVIVQVIRCYINGKIGTWDKDLPLLTMVLRASECQTTGFTPNMLMFGREVNLPIDILTGTARANSVQREPAEWLQHLVSTLSEVHEFARKNIKRTQKRQKRLSDLRSYEKQYSTGDLVYVVDESVKIGQSKKLRSPWKGPFLVVKARHPLYTVKERKRQRVLHHDKLKLCEDHHIPIWLRRARSSLYQQEETVDSNEDFSETNTIGSDEEEIWTTPDTTLTEENVESDSSDDISDAPVDNEHDQDADAFQLSSSPRLSEDVRTTRSGRTVNKPSYLRDYDTTA